MKFCRSLNLNSLPSGGQFAVILLLAVLLSLSALPKKQVSILVAARPLEARRPLEPGDLIERRLAKALLPGGVIGADKLTLMIGQQLKTAVAQHQAITWGDVDANIDQPSSTIPAGKRLITLAIDNLNDVVSHLNGSESVDLIYTPHGSQRTVVFAERLTMLPNTNVDVPGTYSGTGRTLATFVINIEEAMLLTHAALSGSFRILLRNPIDLDPIDSAKARVNQTMVQRRLNRDGIDSGPAIIYGME